MPSAPGTAHLMAAAGCIGHLRGDMGREGNSFYTTWFDHQEDLMPMMFAMSCSVSLRMVGLLSPRMPGRTGRFSPGIAAGHEGDVRMDGRV